MSVIKFRYPKIALLIIAIVLAYFIFKNPGVNSFVSGLGSLGYLGVFIAGLLISFGFTTPFAVGFFIVLNPENILLAVFIASLGAVLGDLVIFNFVRVSFQDEFDRLENTKIFKEAGNLMEKELGHKLKIYLMYLFAEIVIASPLPDEAGITMLAGLTKIRQYVLGIMSFAMHFIGIYIITSL